MTELQIKYQALQLDRQRVAKELELNERQVSEVERHNLETEAVARENLNVSWYEAQSGRINANANAMNAETNRLNYGVNLMNAQTNRYNAETNRFNAETNRLNYGVNLMNAETNARNAAVNERNAAVNEGNLALAQQLQPYRIAQIEAETSYSQAQARDLAAKEEAGYWQSSAWSNYNSRATSALISTAGSLLTAGLKAGSAANATRSFMTSSATYWPVSTGTKSTGLSTNVVTNALPPGRSSVAATQAAGAVSPDVLGAGAIATVYSLIEANKLQLAYYEIQKDPDLRKKYAEYEEYLRAQTSRPFGEQFQEWLSGASLSNITSASAWEGTNQVKEFYRWLEKNYPDYVK